MGKKMGGWGDGETRGEGRESQKSKISR